MKKAILVIAGVLAVLVGLVFLLPFAINSNALRSALSDQLSEASGAEIALNGPIHFSILPDFGVVVEDFAYRAGDGTLSVAAERSVASVALLPLLSGQIRITGIELKSPHILLVEGQTSAAPAPAEADTGDIFRVIAGYLEAVSIDHIVVTDGQVAQETAGAAASVISDIDLRLSIPGIAAPASLVAAGVVNGDRVELGAEIGSLRDLLARQPAKFSVSAKSDKPLHPALANIAATGSIQLADDGSYNIIGGEIDSSGQKMLLDTSYVPGDRPSVVARIKAGDLSFSDFTAEPSDAPTGDASVASPSGSGPDLSALAGFDVDLELYAQSLRVDDATARDVVVAAKLQDGRLLVTVDSTDIAGGSVLASMAADANAAPMVTSGSLNLSSIDIEQLSALAGLDSPATGRISSELQYAFTGLNVGAIRDSLNLRGTVTLAGGKVSVPQLASVAGPGSGVVEALEAHVKIEDIRQPMVISGSARWNGETVGLTTSFTATDLLWQQPATFAIDLTSQPLNARFSGTLTSAGQVSGQADITSASLTRTLGWLGQNVSVPLGQFAYSGRVAVGTGTFAMTEATLRLDDIRANGSLSVETSGKPRINADLFVDVLDFATLVGGEGSDPATASTGPAAIDLSALRLFDADIRLGANQLGYGSIKAGPATATLSVVGGVAKLTIPQAQFYQGAVAANVTANGAGDVPAIDLVATMEGVQALPLLSDAAGFDRVEGQLRASIQVAGAGADSQVFARSLNGPVSVVVTDGALRGIDVAGLVRNVRSLIGPGYAQDPTAKTEFSELSIPLNIVNGVAQAAEIRVLGPFIRMSGAGSVDLAAQTIDMRLDPRVVGSLDGQGGEFDVSGIGMPIIVTGQLSRPSIYPDISGILADPNRALTALSQLGGGVGELATNASSALGGLENVLGGQTGSTPEDALANLIGELSGGQTASGDAGQPSLEQSILGGLVGGVLGQQIQPAPTPATTSPAPQQDVSLPRRDPRGPYQAPAPTPAPAEPQPQPQPPSVTDTLVDSILPQLAPQPDNSGATDLLGGFLQQMGR